MITGISFLNGRLLFKTVIEIIEGAPGHDKETKFLNKAAAVFNYRRCGLVPPKKTGLLLNAASAEVKSYCSARAAAVLHTIMEENNPALLEMWLSACDQRSRLVSPDTLPGLLEKAAQQHFLRPLAVKCSGNRGLWISQFNSAWDYFHLLPVEEIWQTGKPEDRVKVLKELRQTAPDKAREWLQQTWEQENAAAKAELLKCLRINSIQADLPWLESLLAEKGQKVKDEALTLLKQVPGSSIIRQYERLLSEAVSLKKEKALMGMMNKTSIQFKLPSAVDETIFKSGIEKLAGPKSSFSDEQYILYQVIGFVPPSFWEKHFDAAPGQVFAHFEKHAPFMLPAIGIAVARFNETEWVPRFLEQEQFYADFLRMLPASEQEKYLLKFLRKEGKELIPYALMSSLEWGRELALTAIRLMADYPYEYNGAFFNKHIRLIPVSVIDSLEKIQPKDVNSEAAWIKSRTQLLKLLHLKKQITEAFNT